VSEHLSCAAALVAAGLLAAGCDDEVDCEASFCGSPLAADATSVRCNDQGVRDIRQLGCAPKLKRVDLSGTPTKDLEVLRKLSELQSVELARTKVTSLAPLAALPKLERVDLRWVDVDMSPLASASKLLSLKIGGAHMTTLDAVKPLTQLKQLTVRDAKVSDLGPLAALTKLESLELRATRVADLSPIAKLPELQRLTVDGSPVQSLAPLENMRRLRSIDLQGTSVSKKEVARFRKAKPAVRVIER
jgi:Leucine-rich repeat (LRR) protein